LRPETGPLLQRYLRFRASGTKTGFPAISAHERRNSHVLPRICPRFAAAPVAMSKICPPGQESVHHYVTALDQLWEIDTADIEEGWIRVMTKRLLKELNRQIAAVEATRIGDKPEAQTLEVRANNAKVLASLQHTLERLMRLDKERDATLESKKGRTYASAREEIQRKFAKRIAAGGKAKLSH
jgi:hypothetical protein